MNSLEYLLSRRAATKGRAVPSPMNQGTVLGALLLWQGSHPRLLEEDIKHISSLSLEALYV